MRDRQTYRLTETEQDIGRRKKRGEKLARMIDKNVGIEGQES